MRSTHQVPVSSYLILLGLMIGFVAVCLLITFDAPAAWWTIPALAVVSIVIGLRLKQRERLARATAAPDDLIDDRLLD